MSEISRVMMMFWALLVFMSLDYLTGTLTAAITGRYSSKISTSGILKKSMIAGIAFTFLVVDFLVPELLSPALGTITTSFALWVMSLLCLAEIGSILENAHRAGAISDSFVRNIAERLTAASQRDKDKSP